MKIFKYIVIAMLILSAAMLFNSFVLHNHKHINNYNSHEAGGDSAHLVGWTNADGTIIVPLEGDSTLIRAGFVDLAKKSMTPREVNAWNENAKLLKGLNGK